MHREPKRIVIAGGTGFIGLALAEHLAHRGQRVVLLGRKPPRRLIGDCEFVPWNGRTLSDWITALEGAAGLVNLVGRSVDCVKTPDHVDEILRSRVEATAMLGRAMRTISTPPAIWVQMSTAHIYGDPPRGRCVESSPLGWGLAPDVGRAWEAAFHAAKLPEQRGVILRTSFVIGHDRGAGGGALARLRWLTKWGLGGRVGTGQQGMSWIHELDMCRLVEHALTTPAMQGVYIASAPDPVSQIEFMQELRKCMKMPIGLPAPAWLVHLGAKWILKTDPELALYGRYVESERLAAEGFVFQYSTLAEALRALIR